MDKRILLWKTSGERKRKEKDKNSLVKKRKIWYLNLTLIVKKWEYALKLVDITKI